MAVNNSFKVVTSEEKREKCTIWLKVGYVNGTNRDGSPRIISTPMDLPIGNMKEADTTSGTKEWREYMMKKNAVLHALLKEAEKVNPGSEEPLEGLQLFLCKTPEVEELGDIEITTPTLKIG